MTSFRTTRPNKRLCVNIWHGALKTPYRADAQSKLAAWCDENGLKERAMAHYSTVIRFDPSRETAWKHLGYKKQGRRWVKPEDLAAEKLEAARQKQADKFWGQTLEKLRVELLSKDAAKRAHGEEALKQVTDPRAVPMILRISCTAMTGCKRPRCRCSGRLMAQRPRMGWRPWRSSARGPTCAARRSRP